VAQADRLGSKVGGHLSRVKIRSVSPNPPPKKKIATKHFFALTVLMGHGESQKKVV